MQNTLIIYRNYIQAHSPVNTVEKVTEYLELFASQGNGMKIRI